MKAIENTKSILSGFKVIKMRCSNFMHKTTCHATLNSSTITNEQNIVLKIEEDEG